MALTKTPIELSSTPSIVDGGNATAITIASDESATFTGPINLTAGALAAAGNAGLSHRSADNKVYLQAGTGGFNILDDQQNTHLSIDSAGVSTFYNNVGIGTSPSHVLHVDASSTSTLVTIHNTNGSSADCRGLDVETSTTGTTVQRWLNAGTLLGSFTATGCFLVGGTNPNPTGANVAGASIDASGEGNFSVDGAEALRLNRKSSNGDILRFFREATQVGYISATTTGVSYQSGSDRRLKENIADADDAGSKIDAIQVRKFDWKVDGSHQDYGMIAQELQTVAPEAVGGNADSDKMMGVDYSKLVPMMLKEIQSLRSRVAELENN